MRLGEFFALPIRAPGGGACGRKDAGAGPVRPRGGEARRGQALLWLRDGTGVWPARRSHDTQPVPDQRLGGHLPGEALEECRQPLRLWLLLRGAGEGLGGGERAAGDPHAAPLPPQRLPPQDFLRGRYPERGAASLRHRVPAPRRRYFPGTARAARSGFLL